MNKSTAKVQICEAVQKYEDGEMTLQSLNLLISETIDELTHDPLDDDDDDDDDVYEIELLDDPDDLDSDDDDDDFYFYGDEEDDN